MDSTERVALTSNDDLFVVRTQMAADRTRAADETLARVAAGPRSGTGARAWLGRRLVGAGLALAGDGPAAEPTTTTGQPC
jgi:hypothetical protein